MEIGVSVKSLEHVTPRVERNLATGFVRTVSITLGTTEYRYWFAGTERAAVEWHERCTLYTDSQWARVNRGGVDEMLSARAGVEQLTAENVLTIARVG